MEMRQHTSLRHATDDLRAARDAYAAAQRKMRTLKNALSSESYWAALDHLGDTHRALQRARYAYKTAGGF